MEWATVSFAGQLQYKFILLNCVMILGKLHNTKYSTIITFNISYMFMAMHFGKQGEAISGGTN